MPSSSLNNKRHGRRSTTIKETTLQRAEKCDKESQKLETDMNRNIKKVCEVLADAILYHPTYAYRNSLLNRLWKKVFYSRISAVRIRIQKERKNPTALEVAQKGLATNLEQGTQFYQYIKEQLVSRLEGDEKDQQDNDEEKSCIDEGTELDDVVPVLATSVLIHLGDLNRYAKKHDKAIEAYEMAAKLGPGHGLAYNQLGVTFYDQDKSQTFKTLYYYTRSRHAVTTIFPGASNLDLVLQNNKVRFDELDPSNQRVDCKEFLCKFSEYCRLRISGESVDGEAVWGEMSQLLPNKVGDKVLCQLIVILIAHDSRSVPRVGQILVERILATWETAAVENKSLSARLVVPALLAAEWLHHKNQLPQQMIRVLMQLHRIASESPGEHNEGTDYSEPVLPEYELLIGFAPLEFLNSHVELENGCRSKEAAKEVVEKQDQTLGNGPVKLQRLLWFVQVLINESEGVEAVVATMAENGIHIGDDDVDMLDDDGACAVLVDVGPAVPVEGNEPPPLLTTMDVLGSAGGQPSGLAVPHPAVQSPVIAQVPVMATASVQPAAPLQPVPPVIQPHMAPRGPVPQVPRPPPPPGFQALLGPQPIPPHDHERFPLASVSPFVKPYVHPTDQLAQLAAQQQPPPTGPMFPLQTTNPFAQHDQYLQTSMIDHLFDEGGNS